LDDTTGKGAAHGLTLEELDSRRRLYTGKLQPIPTMYLVEELQRRQGVETVATLEPRETMSTLELAELEGSGLLLWITD
jgi:hypothetical protein